MQSTGQTATHPVSRQSRQSRVMMYAMPSSVLAPVPRLCNPFVFFLTTLTRPGKEAASDGNQRLLVVGFEGEAG